MEFSEIISSPYVDNSMLADLYNQMCEATKSSWRAACWDSPVTQDNLFKWFCKLPGVLEGSVLDIGCGHGDLFAQLKMLGHKKAYCGIDISPKMVENAKVKHPKAKFECIDFADFDGSYDFVVSIGAFNFKVADQTEYIESMICKMYKLAKKAAVIYLLSEKMRIPRYNILCYYDPSVIVKHCLSLTSRVIMEHAFVRNQFVVAMYRD